jgi:nucleoside-diphosphate-sugar epimerase
LGHYIVAVRDNEARRSLIRLYDVARKLAHTLSPIDQEVWNALDDAEDVLCNEMWELKDKR